MDTKNVIAAITLSSAIKSEVSRENADCEYIDQDELRRHIPTSIRGIRL